MIQSKQNCIKLIVFQSFWHFPTMLKSVYTSDRPKQDFTAETEPKPNFGYNSSFGRNRSRNRNTKKIEINDFERT